MEGPHEDKRDALMKTMTSGDLRVTSLSLSLLFPTHSTLHNCDKELSSIYRSAH